MNKIIFFSFLLLLIPIGTSYGATLTNIGDEIFVLVQTTVRNSDETLLVYMESTKFTTLNMEGLESFLDYEASLGNDPIITIDEQKYEVIRRTQSQTSNSQELVASTILHDTKGEHGQLLARFAHDGFVLTDGDTRESLWTFIRPVS